MAAYRLSLAAQANIVGILAWSNEQFGEEARIRYEKLLAAAMRDAASSADGVGSMTRPEWGHGAFFWHLSRSRVSSSGGPVHRPRHFLVCRRDGDLLVIVRVLHEAMDTHRHRGGESVWD